MLLKKPHSNRIEALKYKFIFKIKLLLQLQKENQ